MSIRRASHPRSPGGSAVWVLAAFLFHYSSLAALIALAAAPLLMLALADQQRAIAAGLLSVLAVIQHRENIRRLISGREPKIGEGKPPSPRR